MKFNLSSKDAVIRVWDRKTLELYRVLRGHEGPVNAVGLQNGRVVCFLFFLFLFKNKILIYFFFFGNLVG